MQRRRIQEDAEAGEQRQQQSAREPEAVEHGQRIEDGVLRTEVDDRRKLVAIREQIPMAQHDALGCAFRSRREQNCRRLVGALRAMTGLGQRRLEQGADSGDDAISRAASSRYSTVACDASAWTIGSSLAFSTNLRAVTTSVISAARHADWAAAAPVEKLSIAGTRPSA